mmetsp:Transcript_29304/g.63558  ORF Transcript_29304/g.63558 Transcript_29304/m.63558 type:complete len:259 (+) Transcript_29304:205-981(+)
MSSDSGEGDTQSPRFDAVPDANSPDRGRSPSHPSSSSRDDGLQRSDTNVVLRDFQAAGAGVVAAGIALAAIYFGVAGSLVWYSSKVATTCRPPFGTAFRVIGSLDGVLGVLLICFALAARGLVDAMGHGVLAEKYETEGRLEEAEQQKHEAAKKLAAAMLQGCFPGLGFVLLQVCLLIAWGYGAYQATLAEAESCHQARVLFWTLFGVSLVTSLLTCCFRSHAQRQRGPADVELPEPWMLGHPGQSFEPDQVRPLVTV